MATAKAFRACRM